MLDSVISRFRRIFHNTHFVPVLFLSTLFFILSVLNFSNTWLLGWDNLVPELNFPLNFSRAFSATWINNQGLGHVGGHGHAANLPHTLILWLMSSVIPTESLRLIFLLLMYAAGGIGTYFLTHSFIHKQSSARFAAVLTALVYSFHLGTIQQFFTPLESFIIFHGLLPWVLLYLFKLLRAPHLLRSHLLGFFGLSWLFSSIGFLPPLFVVYGLMLSAIFGWFLFAKRSLPALKRVVLLGGIILAANLYWLGPVAYFTATSSNDYLNSQNNQLSTDGYNWQSISNGGLLDVALVRGFLFWALDVKNSASDPLYVMQPWFEHYQNPLVVTTALAWFGLAGAGVWLSIARTRDKKIKYRTIALATILILLLISLGQRIPGISLLSQAIKELPVINQAFRAAFTKVSVPFVLSIAVLGGIALSHYLERFSQWLQKRKLTIQPLVHKSITGFLLILALGLGSPVLRGQLFSDHLRHDLPEEYHSVISFFKKQPKTERIAVFPMIEHWGWHYYDWGHIGSGFWWYGLEQPIMDRSFDAWSKYNETFYHQVSTALHENDVERVFALLEQYHISWIILDPHMIQSSSKTMNEQLALLQAELDARALSTTSFEEITAYQLSQDWTTEANETASFAQGDATYSLRNPLSDALGNYASDFSYTQSQAYFPFSHLTSTHGITSVSQGNEILIPAQSTPGIQAPSRLTIPRLTEKLPALTQIRLSGSELSIQLVTQLPKLRVNSELIDLNTQFAEIFSSTEIVDFEEYFVSISDTVQQIQAGNPLQSPTLISLDPLRNLPIQVFENESAVVADVSERVKWASMHSCADGSDSTGMKFTTARGTTVQTGAESGCFSAEIGRVAVPTSSSELHSLSFSYELAGIGIEHLCVSRQEDEVKTCYSGELASAVQSTTGAKEVVVTFLIPQSGTYWLDFQVAPQTNFTTESVVLGRHERVFATTVNSSSWSEVVEEKSIDFSNEITSLELVLSADEASSYDLSQISGMRNCDVFSRGSVSSNSKGTSLSMTAVNGGIACLPITISDLNLSSIITVSGAQKAGKRPEITVFNMARKITDGEFSPSGAFSLSIPRIRNSVGREADQLSITARSFPHTRTVLELDSLAITPLPIAWYSQFALMPIGGAIDSLKVGETVQTSSWLVKKNLASSPEPRLVVLDQSYHSGWLAFSLTDWRLLPHFEYNGWANAWEVPAGAQQVWIIFWPQLLSFVGYGVLVVSIVGLAVFSQKKPLASATAGAHPATILQKRFRQLRKTLSGRN